MELGNISGTCSKGMTLQNVNRANLHDIRVTGYTGPLLATNAVSGSGLGGAVVFTPGGR
jgi:hypothetical protein